MGIDNWRRDILPGDMLRSPVGSVSNELYLIISKVLISTSTWRIVLLSSKTGEIVVWDNVVW